MKWKAALLILGLATAAFGQTAGEPAIQVREQLQSILRNSPPQVVRVLRLDPTLLTNDAYMNTYPALGAFVKQHPELQHNPAYFFGAFEEDESQGGYRVWREILSDVGGFIAFLVVMSVLIWMIRTLIEQRRWSRLSAVQTEVHSKLLDRFTSNEELLAYLQTAAGKKFLESAPIPLEAGPRPMSAPVGRIFWSLQAGLVLIAGGIGFELVSRRMTGSDAAGMYGVGIIIMLIGVALVLSAGIFYGLSRRFGLWQPSVS